MTRHLRMLPVLFALAAAGCSVNDSTNSYYQDRMTQAAEAEKKVTLTLNAAAVAGCRSVGLVEGQAATHHEVDSHTFAEKYYVWTAGGDMALYAIQKGGNVVLLGAGSTTDKKIGEAYACPRSP